MALWTLHAAYDADAHVWYAVDCDCPGLVTEAESLERLRERAAAVPPELIEVTADDIAPERRAGLRSLPHVA